MIVITHKNCKNKILNLHISIEKSYFLLIILEDIINYLMFLYIIEGNIGLFLRIDDL